MADVTTTPADAGIGTGTTVKTGWIAGAAIAALDVVYKNTSTGKYELADNTTSAKATVAGIAITKAAADQPFVAVTAGPVYGFTLLEGKGYELSSTGGKVADAGDAGSTDFGVSLGSAQTTGILFLAIANSGGQVA